MRILAANKFYWPKGGSERVFFELNRGYAARGHEVAPFSMADPRNVPSPWSRHFVSGIDYDRVRGPIAGARAALRAIHSFEASRRIGALCREFRPDVAHLHNIHHQLSPSIVSRLAKLGVPSVFTLHDYKLLCPSYLFFTEGAVCERCKGGRFHEAIVHRCVRGSRAASAAAALESAIHRARGTIRRGVRLFVAPSRFLAGKLVEHGFDESSIRVVPNGVRIDGAADGGDEAAAGGDTGEMLYAGRLSAEKGVEILLEAMAFAPRVKLAVAGSGPSEALLRARAERAAPGRVEFLGALGRRELFARLRRSRALLVPSVCYENAPVAALEALACGIPVIGSALGGIPEIVRHESTGLLAPPGDAAALAQAILRLADDAALARRLGAAGRAIAASEYDLDVQIDRMLAILEEAASFASR